ncbi:MAG TPA: LuxR C-terminal-related transcriptional regulator [Microthrixaceae bacterium]|nr:LuxR C-terminal-related transcriptional regulator [Microthrixaceae bacterium]
MEGESTSREAAGDQLPPFAVRRTRLEELLDKVPPGGTGLVVAAAGSGKSVLVGQWLASLQGTSIARVQLTERHNDAMAMGGELLRALAHLTEPLDNRLSGRLTSGARGPGLDFYDRLLQGLASQPEPVVIVFDDAHRVTDPEALEGPDRLIGGLPDNVRVVIAARWDPGLSLRALRLSGRTVEVRAADLCFDDVEAAQLVRSVSGHDLNEQQIRTLVDRTDGWAAGLQLSAVSLRSTNDPDRFVRDFAGTDRLVVEYLTAEVLDQQEPTTRRFLLQTSVLAWMTPELCAAVTRRDDAGDVLATLLDRSLFVIEMDRTGTRLRYHHLFAELLAQQAVLELDATELAQLRLDAAAWFRDHGAVGEAMDLLLDAGAWSDAFDLVVEAGNEYFARGESATLVNWLARIDHHRPTPPSAVTMNLLAAQIAACQFTAAADTYRRLRRRNDLKPDEAVAADALYTCCGIDELPADEVLDVAARVLAALPDLDTGSTASTDFLGIGGPDTIQILAAYMLGLAHFHQGDLVSASAMLDWVRTLPGMQFPIWRINALGGLALVRAWTGHLAEAHRLGSSALEVATLVGADHHVAVSHARLALGLVAIERYELEAAASHLGVAGHPGIPHRGATDHDTRAVLVARLTALTDGPDAALELLDRPGRAAVPPDLLQRTARARRAQWQLATGNVTAARLTVQPHRSDRLLLPTRVDLDLAGGNLPAARSTLDHWRPDGANLLDTVQHALRTAVLLAASGDEGAAAAQLAERIPLAQAEGLIGPFLDCPAGVQLLAGAGRSAGSPFVQRIVAADREARRRRAGPSQLVVPLTDREVEVLALLPTRLSNTDIGRQLLMSVNTVKTHLRSIYAKLGVGDRDAAVERAEELGLL